MTFAEFELHYFQPYVYWWLALAALLGLLIGLQLGQRLGARRAQAKLKRDAGRSEPAVSAAAALDAVAAEASEEAAPAVAQVAGNEMSDLAGINAKQIAALNAHGIDSLNTLREQSGTKPKREALADALQLEDFVVNKWARMAQLLALEGMTPEWAELLVVFGVSSLGDLAARNPESVHHKLQDLNNKEQRVDTVPSRQQLEAWVTAATDS